MTVLAPPPRATRVRRSSGGRPAGGGRQARLLWLGLALALGLLFALRTSARALGNPYMVEDDVRQHVFWTQRLHDSALFPADPIADYYASQSPPGYVAVYFLGTLLLDAITFSKLLPIALTIPLVGFAYLLGWRLFRRADAAGLGAVLLAWTLWQYDDFASATPRSFVPLLLVAFLACLVAGQRRASLAVLALQALFYPLGCTVMLGTWALWLFGRHRLDLRAYRREIGWLVVAVAITAALALQQASAGGRFGPLVSAEQARGMAEFQWDGRVSYFHPDPFKFWLWSTHSGLALKRKDPLLGGLPDLAIPFALAAALAVWACAGRFGLIAPPPIPRRAALLVDLLAASFILFFLAHILIFRLYLPSRQVQFSLPIAFAIGGGLALALLTRRLAAALAPGRSVALATLLALGAIVPLAIYPPPEWFYVVGRYPRLYEYLQAQPKETLVAALPGDSSNLPLFGRRPVLVSWEHALPYHLGYYEPLRRRTEALLAAYYDESPGPILELAEREGAGIIVANLAELEAYRREHDLPRLGLEELAERCGALRERELVPIPFACARSNG